MRVAMLCATQPHRDDEGWSREPPIIPLSQALHRAGHQVHIFLPTGAPQSSYNLIEGLHYHRVTTNGERPSPQEMAEALLYYVGATQEVAGPFDVLHAHDPLLLNALADGYARLRINTVLSLWTEEQVRSCAETTQGLPWRIEEIVGAAVCPSRLVQQVASAVLDLPSGRILLQYPGVTLSRWSRWVDQGKLKKQLGFGPFDPLLLCVGEFDTQGSAWITLEAVFAVRESNPSFRVVFLGDGPLFPYLRDRSRVLGFDGCARFLRYLPEDQMADLYNGCDMVYLPSGKSSDVRAIVEAWCAGKPTIIPDVTVPEFYEPGVHGLAVPQRIHVLAQSINRLLDNRQEALAMGQAGWQKAHAEFSWDTIADRMARLYTVAAPSMPRRQAEKVAF